MSVKLFLQMFQPPDKSSVLAGSTLRQAVPADEKVQYDADPGLKKDDNQPGQCGGGLPLMDDNKKGNDTNDPFSNIENAGERYHERILSEAITVYLDPLMDKRLCGVSRMVVLDTEMQD